MIEQLIDKMLGLTPKRRFRECQERIERLPEDYQEAADAVKKRALSGGLESGDAVLAMLEDLADFLEQGAADRTPVRDLIGDDQADFVRTFVANYKGRTWKTGKKKKLSAAIDRAVAEQERAGSGTPPTQVAEPETDDDDDAPASGSERRHWRQYRAREKRLPAPYRSAIEALRRYSYYSGLTSGPEPGTGMMAMFDDLADLFEQAVANGTSLRDLVGDDPVEFADTFFRNYRSAGDPVNPALDE